MTALLLPVLVPGLSFLIPLDRVPEKSGKSGPPSVIVNKVLSKHDHTHLFTYFFMVAFVL